MMLSEHGKSIERFGSFMGRLTGIVLITCFCAVIWGSAIYFSMTMLRWLWSE